MAVITHILGLKTFMFHGFGVQGNLVPNMAAIEKKTHLQEARIHLQIPGPSILGALKNGSTII